MLIPFVNEQQVLDAEKLLFESGYQMSEADKIRNSTAFHFVQYNYSQEIAPKPLKSTLTNLTDTLWD